MSTLAMLDAVVARLKVALPSLEAEYYPENPEGYRLNHPVGALLVSYPGSRYGDPFPSGATAQERDFRVAVTVVMRQLHGRDGAVQALDDTRAALLGVRLPDCMTGLRALRDAFLGQQSGLWHYVIELAAEKLEIENAEEPDGPLLRHVTALGPVSRTETIKQPTGDITVEDFPL